MTFSQWIKSNALIPSQTRPLHHECSEIPGVRKHVPLLVIQGYRKIYETTGFFPLSYFLPNHQKASHVKEYEFSKKTQQINSFCCFFQLESMHVASKQIVDI